MLVFFFLFVFFSLCFLKHTILLSLAVGLVLCGITLYTFLFGYENIRFPSEGPVSTEHIFFLSASVRSMYTTLHYLLRSGWKKELISDKLL